MENISIDNELIKEMIDFRRWMHQNPELSGSEFETSNRICYVLNKYGIEYYKGIESNGIVAIIRGGKPGKTVAAKADIDALPINEKNNCSFKSLKTGVMHACGHDANTAILLGTAISLKKIEKEIEGNIKLFFEPAEETIGGSQQMIKEGCMENPKVDNIIGLHVMPYLNVGQIEVKKGCLNASTNEVEITVNGKGGHAAEPDTCIDPVVVMAYIITALQTFVSRNTNPTQSAVLTFGYINGGTKGNIIPDSVFIKGTLRTLVPEQREYAKRRVKEIAEGVASGFGATADVKIIDSYDAVINDEAIVDSIIEVGQKMYGKGCIVYKENPSMGAEDFSYYTKSARGAYFHIGCKNPDEKGFANLHTENFHLDEDCIKKGIEIQTAVLLKMLG